MGRFHGGRSQIQRRGEEYQIWTQLLVETYSWSLDQFQRIRLVCLSTWIALLQGINLKGCIFRGSTFHLARGTILQGPYVNCCGVAYSLLLVILGQAMQQLLCAVLLCYVAALPIKAQRSSGPHLLYSGGRWCWGWNLRILLKLSPRTI